MAKKLFLNREGAIPTAHVFSVSREGPELEAVSAIRSSPVSGITEQLPFLFFDETTKSFPKFNANWLSLFIKFRRPGEEKEPMFYLKECIITLTNY